MALQKTKTLPNGLSGNYWRLTAFTATKSMGGARCTATLSLFVNASYAATTPIPNVNLTISFTMTPEEATGNVPALCYAKFKAHGFADLQGAEDV